jgi:hypothetical protein
MEQTTCLNLVDSVGGDLRILSKKNNTTASPPEDSGIDLWVSKQISFMLVKYLTRTVCRINFFHS